jgi:hypothetical protein
MALTAYQQQVQRLLHDPNATYFSLSDITSYINEARGQIASSSQCIRILLSGGTITSIAINSAGSGYAGSLTVTITGSGQQAAATGTISGGAVNTVTLTNGGWGYITGTTTTVTAAGSTSGTNATFIPTIDQSLTTIPGQEVYQFTTANALAQTVAGVQGIIGLLSVACAWGTNAAMKPTLTYRIWNEFQAYLRSYNSGMQNYPTVWSQYSYGVNGSIYLWPLPSTASQMDWDCYCLPIDLVDDTTAEAIPYPWTTCIKYYAAHLAYDNAQRKEDADRMMAMYDKAVAKSRAQVEAPVVFNYYTDFE